jgi:hypothetical protein
MLVKLTPVRERLKKSLIVLAKSGKKNAEFPVEILIDASANNRITKTVKKLVFGVRTTKLFPL